MHTPRRAKTIKILLIEDDEIDAGILKKFLTDTGKLDYEIEWASHLEQAEQILGKFKPDAILLDLTLPDGSGITAIERVQSWESDLSLIILTGQNNDELAAAAIRAGVQDYLIKGQYNGEILRRSIRYALERNRIRIELDHANAALKDMVGKDPLTGLLNRRGFREVLAAAVAEKKRLGIHSHVLLLDFDDFKSVNDQFGHGIGDIALTTVAKTIKKTVRETDPVARIGGDEFIVLLSETREAEAVVVAEKIRLAVAKENIVVESGNRISLTVSIGMAPLQVDTLSIDALLQGLHSCLRTSKLEGKNRVTFEKKDSGAPAADQDELSRLRDVLTQQKYFQAVAQPLVALQDKSIAGYEMLSRLAYDHFKLPGEFLQFARSQNVLTLVDRICLRACLLAATNLPGHCQIHVNLYPSTLMEYTAVEIAKDCKFLRSKRKLCLELSEQQIVGDPAYLTSSIQELKKAGILIAIDDLGFGHTSLESLVILEPDIVKIDKSCILGISKQKEKVAQLKRFLKVIQSCEAQAVAEGIETEEDLQILMDLGITYGQGFLLGKPAAVKIP